MRNLILPLFAILVFSCSTEKAPTREDLVKSSIENYIKPKLNDPETYEFASLTLLDSTTYLDNINYRIDYFTGQVDRAKNEIDRYMGYKEDLPSMFDQIEVDRYQADVDKNTMILSEINTIQEGLGDQVNNVAAYTYSYGFRSKNSFGALVLQEYLMQIGPGPEYEVLQVAEDRDGLYLDPNGFPGYDDMISKYIGK